MLPDEDADRTEALAAMVAEHMLKVELPPNVKRIYHMTSDETVARGTVEFKSGKVERFGVRVDSRIDTVKDAVQVTMDMLRKVR